MAELFDDIKFEVYISAAWLDITGDVLVDPSPRWNRGIMGNGPLDRVGSPGYLTFSLNNSQHNSASTLGYYSPGHPSALANWASGLPVRLSFEYEGLTYYKFYGRIKPDGIKVIPGQFLERRVDVTVHDYMAQAQAHEIKLLTLAENKRIDEVVPLIVANMPIAPLATDYNTGAYTFPTVFDTVRGATTATAEFQKLANSELGYIYVRGDFTNGETLVVDGSATRQSVTTAIPVSIVDCGFLLKEDAEFLLKEDGGKIILDVSQDANFTDSELYPGTEINYGDHLINKVEVSTYPRRIDSVATTTLFTLQSEFSLLASETKSNYYGRYRDPSGGASYVNGKDMRVPTTDDFLAETTAGVNASTDITLTATFGTEGASYDLVNNVASERVVKTLKATGKGIYIYDAVKIIYESTDSQLIHGLRILNVDMKYQDDPTVGEFFANILLSQLSNPALSVPKMVTFANRNSMTINGFLALEPGTKLSFNETVTGIDSDFFVQGYEAEITDGKHVWWKPVLQSALLSAGPWIWDTSTWSQSTNWASL